VGTVGVLVAADDAPGGPIPSAALVGDVQALLDQVAPVIGESIAVAPTALPVDVTIALAPDTAEVRAAVTAAYQAWVRREGKPGGTLYASRRAEAIARAAGEAHHRVVAPTGDVTAAAHELPVPGTITFEAY
jgi:uncharacterized phage protein gp47/JayE